MKLNIQRGRERERERATSSSSLFLSLLASGSRTLIDVSLYYCLDYMADEPVDGWLFSPFVVNPASSSKSNRKTFSSFLFKHYLKRCRAARSIVASFDSRRIPRQIETFLSEEELIFPPNPFVLGKFRSTNCKETNFHDCYMRL